ncbi:MAG: hypothetical protein ACXWGY_04010 [Chthoniobacterales bacterium]
MIVALAIIIVVLTSAALIGHQLEKAPEGFENQTGFHFVRRNPVPGSAINLRAGSVAALAGHDQGTAVVSLP